MRDEGKAKRRIGLILAGGTISGRMIGDTVGEPGTARVTSLLAHVARAMNDRIQIDAATDIYKQFSEDMDPAGWTRMAREVGRLIRSGCDGIVITHGTDTMEYSAAALSLALLNLKVPVCLTGSLWPLDHPNSDGPDNLRSALAFLTAGIPGVFVAFRSVVHLGTHVTKWEAESRERALPARFVSVNRPVVGTVTEGKFLANSVPTNVNYRTQKPFRIQSHFWASGGIGFVTLRPGMMLSDAICESEEKMKAVVLLGYGSGTANVTSNPDQSVAAFARKARGQNIPVFLSSQHFGRVDPTGYSSSVTLQKAGAVSLFDMTPTMAWVKLLWSLENPVRLPSPKELVRRMLTSVSGEIELPEGTSVDEFAPGS